MRTTWRPNQVGYGLVGALIVLEPLEVRRAEDEIIWIVGGNDIFITGHLEINGQQAPPPLQLKARHRYRIRLINITEDNTGDVTLGDSTGTRRLATTGQGCDAGRPCPDEAGARPGAHERRRDV